MSNNLLEYIVQVYTFILYEEIEMIDFSNITVENSRGLNVFDFLRDQVNVYLATEGVLLTAFFFFFF